MPTDVLVDPHRSCFCNRSFDGGRRDAACVNSARPRNGPALRRIRSFGIMRYIESFAIMRYNEIGAITRFRQRRHKSSAILPARCWMLIPTLGCVSWHYYNFYTVKITVKTPPRVVKRKFCDAESHERMRVRESRSIPSPFFHVEHGLLSRCVPKESI